MGFLYSLFRDYSMTRLSAHLWLLSLFMINTTKWWLSVHILYQLLYSLLPFLSWIPNPSKYSLHFHIYLLKIYSTHHDYCTPDMKDVAIPLSFTTWSWGTGPDIQLPQVCNSLLVCLMNMIRMLTSIKYPSSHC